MVFKAAFVKSKQKRDFKGITDAKDVRARMVKMLGEQDLACSGLQALHKVHVWGYGQGMVSYAPDLHCAGSLRCTADGSGERFLIMAGLANVRAAAMKLKEGQNNEPTMNDLVNFLKSITTESAKNLASTCPLTHGVVSEGSMLYVPPGYLILEQALTKVSTGYHLSILPATLEAYQNLSVVELLGRALTNSTAVHKATVELYSSMRSSVENKLGGAIPIEYAEALEESSGAAMPGIQDAAAADGMEPGDAAAAAATPCGMEPGDAAAATPGMDAAQVQQYLAAGDGVELGDPASVASPPASAASAELSAAAVEVLLVAPSPASAASAELSAAAVELLPVAPPPASAALPAAPAELSAAPVMLPPVAPPPASAAPPAATASAALPAALVEVPPALDEPAAKVQKQDGPSAAADSTAGLAELEAEVAALEAEVGPPAEKAGDPPQATEPEAKAGPPAEKAVSPDISNFVDGVVVPIPTFVPLSNI